MPVVIALIIVIFFVFISWTWHNLGSIDNNRKVMIIIISLIILFIITFIMFNISKQDISYDSEQEMQDVRNVLVILFTLINALIIMPIISKTISKMREKEITEEQLKKRFIVILVVFVIILIFECGYMKNIQQQILNIYLNAIKAK